MEPDVTLFPLWARGKYYEDFYEGQTLNHHWGRTVRSYDSALFSSLTMHYVPIYFNDEWASLNNRSRGLINPYFTFLLVLGMSVEDTSEGVDGAEGAFLGVREVEILNDVVDGDTITARTTVVAKRRSGSRPHAGIVTWSTVGTNQAGVDVLRFVRTNLTSCRPEKEPFARFNIEERLL